MYGDSGSARPKRNRLWEWTVFRKIICAVRMAWINCKVDVLIVNIELHGVAIKYSNGKDEVAQNFHSNVSMGDVELGIAIRRIDTKHTAALNCHSDITMGSIKL